MMPVQTASKRLLPKKIALLLWVVALFLSTCQGKADIHVEQDGRDDDLYHYDVMEGSFFTATLKYKKCNWTRPPDCQGEPTYKIRLHFVDTSTTCPFPRFLKKPIREAAKLWSRAITSSSSPDSLLEPNQNQTDNPSIHLDKRILSKACGKDYTTTDHSLDGILICVHYSELQKPNKYAYSDSTIVHLTPRGLPSLARIDLNARICLNDGRLDYCDWANVAAHEIGHALGFGAISCPQFERFANNYVHHRNSWHGSFGHGSFGFRGPQSTSEWETYNTSLQYPALSRDGNHWSEYCLASEMMLATYQLKSQSKNQNRRLPLARLTLAAFEDMGYSVNYGCVDPFISILRETCIPEKHPTGRMKLIAAQQRPRPAWPKRLVRKRRKWARRFRSYISKCRRYYRRLRRGIKAKIQRCKC